MLSSAGFEGGRLPGEPFGVLLKPMYSLSQTRHVWEKVVPTLHHESDGLIFTPVAMGYVPGTCNKLLKWKPDNTVDLLMDVLYVPSQPPRVNDKRIYHICLLSFLNPMLHSFAQIADGRRPCAFHQLIAEVLHA